MTEAPARRGQRGRPAADRDAAPARPRAEAAHPAQQRQAALRRHPVGGPGPGRARRVRGRAARPRRRGALPDRPAHRDARAGGRPRVRDRGGAARPRPRRHHARLPRGAARRRGARRADDVPHRGHPQRRGARRLRAGDLAAGLRRLPHRPAAQPALHPRLVGVGARPGGDHVAGDAGPQARDRADRADLQPAPAVRRHAADARRAPRARRGRRRAAAGAGRDRGRRRRADHARPASSGWPGSASRPTSRTPCSPYRSPRSARPCTSTRSARWSTSTRWSSTPTWPTR